MTGEREDRGPAGTSLGAVEIVELPAREAMDLLCRGLADAVRVARCVPSRASVRFGCASIEVEWPVGRLAESADRSPGVEAVDASEADVQGHSVCAPLVGTFYRALEPGAKPFVQLGDLVEPGQQVAIVEAMKLMNPVAADVRGRVAAILADDAEPVEYGQPLLVLRPEDER